MAPPDDIKAEIHALLKRTEQGSDTVRDLAATCLRQFRKECQVAIDWQRTEGARRVFLGEDPDVIQEETERRVGEARQLLRQQLETLLKTAEEKSL